MTARATLHPSRHRHRIVLAVLVIVVSCVVDRSGSVDAATVTASYEHGRSGVVINGYGTRAMGSFRLRDGERSLLAWCLEADVSHSTQSDAYREISPTIGSGELDALLWWLDRQPTIDADTAVAAASLTWFYAAARRSIGPPVWSDGSRAFAPISPVSPERWDALPAFSSAHPVGLVASGIHLDAAERRVLELHQLAGALAGPWQLTIDAAGDRSAATVALRSPAGPLAGQAVELVVEAPGRPPFVRSTTTDGGGQALVALPPLPDGGVIRATVDAPGPHREWDGDGSVQRLATSTSVPIRAETALPPQPAHVEVHKRSTDPTIAPAGGVFVLVDGNGDEVGSATSGADGVARFAPVDPARHPPPYRVSERTAPPGLIATDEVVEVAEASRDPANPTVVDIVNSPVTVPFLVRKRLSIDDAGPADLAGFGFEIRRRADGAAQVLVTGTDGAVPTVRLPLGSYDVCEVGTPDWATELIDTGCRTLTVDTAALANGGIAIDYVNEIPPPIIDTRLTDSTDGDQLVVAGDTHLVDRVELSRLIPGVRYVIDGAIVRPDGDDTSIATSRVELVADAPTATIDIEFGIAFGLDGVDAGPVVATAQVSVGGVVVVDHADLDDPDQTVTVLPPATTTSTTSTTAPPATSMPAPDSTTTIPSTTGVPAVGPPVTTVGPTTVASPPTLPRTGGGDAAAGLLRFADLGFVLGVALVAAAALVPRRPGRDEAGCWNQHPASFEASSSSRLSRARRRR